MKSNTRYNNALEAILAYTKDDSQSKPLFAILKNITLKVIKNEKKEDSPNGIGIVNISCQSFSIF